MTEVAQQYETAPMDTANEAEETMEHEVRNRVATRRWHEFLLTVVESLVYS